MRHHIAFQVLACDVEITTDTQLIAHTLRYLAQDARQEFEVTRSLRFEIIREDNLFAIRQDGEVMCREASSHFVLSRVFGQVRALAIDAMGEWIDLHAATVQLGSKRAVIVGASGAGKSTIAIRLMFSGADVLGDERIMLRGSESVVFPRRFHIKQAGLKHHPEFAGIIDSLPYVEDDTGFQRVYAVAPTDVGYTWDIDVRSIDHVFFIEANKGGQTASRILPEIELAEMLTSQLTPPTHSRPGWIADIAMLLQHAQCRQIYNGDAQLAADEVIRVLMNTGQEK